MDAVGGQHLADRDASNAGATVQETSFRTVEAVAPRV